jgi:hypothetical protein
LLQQLLAEGLLLAFLGAVGGVLLAAAALRVLVAIAPGRRAASGFASIDGAVLAFNAVVATLCAIASAFCRAARGANDTFDALRPSVSSTATPDIGRARRVLVGARGGLSFVVLVANWFADRLV